MVHWRRDRSYRMIGFSYASIHSFHALHNYKVNKSADKKKQEPILKNSKYYFGNSKCVPMKRYVIKKKEQKMEEKKTEVFDFVFINILMTL